MKSISRNFLAKVFLSVFILFSLVSAANAADCPPPGDPAYNPLCFPNTGARDNVNDLVTAVINWFLSITAGVAIFFLIIGGVYYLTAFGDEKRMEEGKKIITYAIYGLILILISYSVVTTLNTIIFS